MAATMAATKRSFSDMDCSTSSGNDEDFLQSISKRQRVSSGTGTESPDMKFPSSEGLKEIVMKLFSELKEISEKMDRIEEKIDQQMSKKEWVPYIS
jgi:hypothetical protein